jgi:hypothetical protein
MRPAVHRRQHLRGRCLCVPCRLDILWGHLQGGCCSGGACDGMSHMRHARTSSSVWVGARVTCVAKPPVFGAKTELLCKTLRHVVHVSVHPGVVIRLSELWHVRAQLPCKHCVHQRQLRMQQRWLGPLRHLSQPVLQGGEDTKHCATIVRLQARKLHCQLLGVCPACQTLVL